MKQLVVAVLLRARRPRPFAAQSPSAVRAPNRADLKNLDGIEPLVAAGDRREKKLPGAVVLIGRGDRTSTRKPSATARSCPRPSR